MLGSFFKRKTDAKAALKPGALARARAEKSAFSEKIAEVPRYPPFKRGIPYLDGALCLAQHNDILDKLRITLRFTESEFDDYARPPLKRFVDYIHLLPASKNHHHRAAGGLLRHSLEVALYAGMSAGGRVFGAEETMKVRTKMRRQYIYAAFILGLGHDIGKAFSDMVVTSRADNSIWNPYTQSLVDWCRDHVPEHQRYLVRFNQKRRHKHHEVFSTFALHYILGPEVIEFLTANGSIMEPLESVIAVTSDTGRIKQFSNADELAKILKLAEKKSCDRDMKGKMDVLGMETSETPFPEHIVAKISHLLHEEFMSANSPKSRLFIVDSQAFVAWDQAFADLLFYEFQKDAIAIPKEADTLLRAMVDFGLVHIEKDAAKRPQVKVRHKSGISHVFNVIELDAGAFSELFDEVIDTGCSVEVVYAKQASDTPASREAVPQADVKAKGVDIPTEQTAQASTAPEPATAAEGKPETKGAAKKATPKDKNDNPEKEAESTSTPLDSDADTSGLDGPFNPQKFLEELMSANSVEGSSAKSTEGTGKSKGRQSAPPSNPDAPKTTNGASAKKKRAPKKPKPTPDAPDKSDPPTPTPVGTKKKRAKRAAADSTAENPKTSEKNTEEQGACAATLFFEMVKRGEVGEDFEVERAADAYHVIAVPNKLYAYLGKKLELPPYRVRSLLTHAYENEPDGIDSIRLIIPIGGPQES